jgi:hypothetical protein
MAPLIQLEIYEALTAMLLKIQAISSKIIVPFETSILLAQRHSVTYRKTSNFFELRRDS